MSETVDHVAKLSAINAMAQFNQWAGIEVVRAGTGHAEIALDWRPEFGQYAGFLLAGMVATLLDTACGFAAVTQLAWF